jgi:Tol biopolymer transport system component
MIAFSAFRNLYTGTWEIYVMDDAGRTLRQVTDARLHDCTAPTWSPDGRYLAFLSAERRAGAAPAIYAADIAQDAMRRLAAPEMGAQIVGWFPDSQRLAFSTWGKGSYRLCAASVDGSGSEMLFDAPGYVALDLSPDGTRIAVVDPKGEGPIVIADSDGGNPRPLTDDRLAKSKPRWSPDGRRIGFVADDGEASLITVATLDGSSTETIGEMALDGHFVWSPGGERIAFVGYREGRYALYVSDLSGSEPVYAAALNPSDESGEIFPAAPAWSPDGAQIAFSSFVDQQFHIYVTDAVGSYQRRLLPEGPDFALVYDLAWC